MWFLHLFHLFLAIAFPFWSKFLSEQKWKIRLHILEVLGCVVISSIAPITFLSVSEYVIARLPPLFVRPSRDVTFYSLILPTTILVGTGVNLTIYSFITIRKVINYVVRNVINIRAGQYWNLFSRYIMAKSIMVLLYIYM